MQGASPPRARHQSISDFIDKSHRYKQILVILECDLIASASPLNKRIYNG